MELIGLDVGFSITRLTSGVARLTDGTLVIGRASSDKKSRYDIIGTGIVDLMAVDAPLLHNLDCPKRTCETVFASGLFSHRCKPGFSHVPGTGLSLRKAGKDTTQQFTNLLRGHDISCPFPRVWGTKNIVEAFPNAFLGVLVSDSSYFKMPRQRRGKKFDWLYEECRDSEAFHSVVECIELGILKDVLSAIAANENHEERAALVCLLTAAAVASGRYTAVGDEKGGYFFLPPWNAWKQWAQQELEKLRKRIDLVEVWINGERFSTTDKIPICD